MRSLRAQIVLLLGGLLGAWGVAAAGNSINEVGAILVYPAILTLGQQGEGQEEQVQTQVETLVTLTNAGPDSVLAHIYYVNGDDGPNSAGYCSECDFEIELTGNDTETLVIQHGPNGIVVASEDDTFEVSCPFPYGMLIVTQEKHIVNGRIETLTDNVLLGEQVVVDYTSGLAFSIPAVTIQGITSNDDWRNYDFDDQEYARLPRVVATDFLAPRAGGAGTAQLTLFTLGFDRGHPPLTDCSVTGFDARENAFSASLQFGCWTTLDLCAVSPEFCHPNLGLGGGGDTHGWFQLNCRVDQDPQAGNGFEGQGGVHGAIVQVQPLSSSLPAGSGGTFAGSASWARLLYQSITLGDPVTLHMEPPF